MLHFGLSFEQEMIVDTVRSFVENEIYPHEAEVERTGEVPLELGHEIRDKCIEAGYFASNISEEFGGGGLGHLDFTLVERELGRASNGLAVFFGRPSGILQACNEAQREQYLFPAVKGEKFDALAMTEPGAGSDVRGMQCSAKQDGSDWIINGSKHFISHANIADFVIVFVAFEIRKGYNSVSHRGYQNCILNFDKVRIPESQILGELHGGFDVMNQWLYATRLTVAATSVGRARRAFEYALPYTVERKQFGQQIGKFQGVSFKLADMITEIDAADWLTLSAAWRLDEGLEANREIASAKVYATEMLARVTDEAIQIFGGMGLMDELPLERFWRDARVERIWDGTSEIQRHIISRELLRPLGG
jgi:acyl-CoA dehydrogenase